MFTPDREPHPAVAETKYLQQPVVFVPLQSHMDSRNLRITVKKKHALVRLQVVNRYTFLGLSHISWSWHLISNRAVKPIRKESFDLSTDTEGVASFSLENAISRVIQFEKTRPPGGNSFFLNIRGRLSFPTLWADAGHVVVAQQFPVRFFFDDLTIDPKPTKLSNGVGSSLSAEMTDSDVTIFWTGFEHKRTSLAIFDKSTGALHSYSPNGKNILAGPITPNFTRAATDNDRGGMELILDQLFPIAQVKQFIESLVGRNEYSHFSHWSFTGLSQEFPPIISCSRLVVEETLVDRQYTISTDCEMVHDAWGTALIDIAAVYTVYADGKIKVSHKVSPRPILQRLPSLPRVGVCMQLVPDLFAINYFGRGPEENYPDRKSASEMGVYETDPTKMGYLKNIVPGENGSRSDCEWISFRSLSGAGLLVVADQNFLSCCALLHSAAALEKAQHTCDLASVENGASPVHVSLDHKIMGVGGDVSWYRTVYPDFIVHPTTDFEYCLHLCPLGENDDAAIIARTVLVA